MKLSGKQKKYLKKNLKKKTLSQIAHELKIPREEIEQYLIKVWGKEKFQKFVDRKNEEKSKVDFKKRVLSFDFISWSKKNRKIIGFLILLVFVGYFNSLGNEFVSDDIPTIVQNKNLDRLNYVFSSFPSFFQPLHLFVINKLFGRVPSCFRLVNILFHLGTVLATYLLLSLLTHSQTALFAASILAVHPIETESVTWISGGPYVKYSFFIILSLLSFILTVKKKQYFWWSQLFFIFALFSSEKAMILPFILLTFILAFGQIKKEWKKLIIPFLITFIWILIYTNRIPERLEGLGTPRTLTQTTKFSNFFLQVPIAITSYLQLIFWPKDLAFYHSELAFSLGEYFLRLILLVILGGITIWGYKNNRHLFFWLYFFLISLLPTLTPFGVSWIVAERYVYLGSIGVFVVVGIILKNLMEKRGFKSVTILFFSFLIIGLLTRTILRNIDWKNQDNLWLATAKTSPSSPQNHNNLGDLYARRGNFQKAIEEFKKAIELKPGYADAYHNLANTYKQIGKIKEAIENYQKAIQFNPHLWQSYQNLGAIYFEKKEFEKAEKYLQKAIKIAPKKPNLYLNLAIIYLKQEKNQEAKKQLENVLSLDPRNQKAKQLLFALP